MAAPRPDLTTLAAFLLGTVFFGSNFVAVRFSNQEMAPFYGAALRFALASLLLFIVISVRRIPMPMGPAFTGAALFGVLIFGVFFGLMYWGLQRAPAGVGSVLFALLPLATLLLAVLQNVEPYRWQGLVGALVAAVGIGVVFRESVSADVPVSSGAAIIAGVFVSAQAGIVVKRFPKSHPIAYNAVAMAAGTVVLTLFSLVAGESRPVPERSATWAALAYLVVFGSIVGFVLLVFVIQRWTASAASYQAVVQPLVTVLVAAWLLDEEVSRSFVVGGLFVVVGVYVGAIHRARPPATPAPKEDAAPTEP